MHNARQIPLDLEMRPALGREHFLIGPCNRDAVAWIDRWPDWPAPLLFLSAPPASGKSHLAAVWLQKAGAVSVRPEMLVSLNAEEIAAQGHNLVIDGIDPWIGAREAEITLFHLYNILKEEGRFLLVASRMCPAQSDFVIADLASRFRAAPQALIKPPDDTLLASVLIKLFSDRQLSVGNDVIRYILPRMERSFTAVRDLVENADRAAMAAKRGISVPLLRQVMSEMQQDDLFDA
ncbi:MAG: DNA replication protein [Alphaproteobacteria bacterium]|nr:DNA replication protein [Alphaproteobacteria bacterium]